MAETTIVSLLASVGALLVVLGKLYFDYRASKAEEKDKAAKGKIAQAEADAKARKEEDEAKVTAAKVMEQIALAQLTDIKTELQQLRDTLKAERADAQVKALAAAKEIAVLTDEVQSLKRQLLSETGDLKRQLANETGELTKKVEAQQIRILALETQLLLVQRTLPKDAETNK